jgi:glycosyltransferase involved in cell wall biosynthesis
VRIAIDGRYGLMDQRRGIGVSIYHVLREWRDCEPDGFRFQVYVDHRASPGAVGEFAGSCIDVVELAARPFAVWEQWALPRAAARGHADVLHAMANVGPVNTSIPLVVSMYDAIEWHRGRDFPSPLTWRHRMSRAYRMRAMAQNARAAAAIITISHHAARDLTATLHIDPGKVRVIALGFAERAGVYDESALSRWGVRPRSYAFAFGALDPRKNSRLLLDLWATRPMPWDLVMVGFEAEALASVRSRYGHVPQIHVSGFEPDPVVQSLLGQAAVFLYPSHYEGFGLPVLEAMAAGIPVIVARGTAAEEISRGKALTASPLDLGEWERAVRVLADNPPMWHEYAEGGRAVAHSYAWKDTAAAILDVYREICQVGS